jgi:hypothetical protein
MHIIIKKFYNSIIRHKCTTILYSDKEETFRPLLKYVYLTHHEEKYL